MISVCMATFNGERFIEEQLLSIYRQTRQPEEVIICDDCSLDATPKIVRRFISDHGLSDSWVFYRNQEKRGYPANFYYAMGLCHGETVFLADQDDLWEPRKIEYMSGVLEERKEIAVLSCTMGIINAQGEELHGLLAPKKRNDRKIWQVSMDQVLYKDCWAGMIMAYRNAFYQKIRTQVEHGGLPHDRALWTLAAQEGSFYQMNCVLAYHRRHDSNTCEEEHRIDKVMRKKRKLWQIDTSCAWLREFLEGEARLTEESRKKIQLKYEILCSRRSNLSEGKIGRMFADYWKYRKQTRLLSLLGDVSITITGR